jgi:hypothetical protein
LNANLHPSERKKGFPVRKNGKNSTVTLARKTPLYRLPSDQHHVALKWSGTYDINIGGFQEQIYGIASPGSRLPKYWTQFFGIYKYCYLESVDLTFQIANLEEKPLRVVLAESNTIDVAPTTFLELAETPRSIQKQILKGGNHSVVTIRRHTSASAIMGHKLEDDEGYWNQEALVPTAPVLPVMVLGMEPILAGSGAYVSIVVNVIYSIKFFTLNHL